MGAASRARLPERISSLRYQSVPTPSAPTPLRPNGAEREKNVELGSGVMNTLPPIPRAAWAAADVRCRDRLGAAGALRAAAFAAAVPSVAA